MYNALSVGGIPSENEQAYETALKAGLIAVVDKCLIVERGRFVLAIILLQESGTLSLRL